MKRFFFKYFLHETTGKLAEEKALSLVRFLESDALKFCLQMFTDGDKLIVEDQDLGIVKKAMVEKYYKRKTKEEIIREAVGFYYTGGSVQKFLRDEEKLYVDEGFTKVTQYGLIIKAIHNDQRMLNFVFIRGDNILEEVKKTCRNYERNQ